MVKDYFSSVLLGGTRGTPFLRGAQNLGLLLVTRVTQINNVVQEGAELLALVFDLL